MGALSHISTYSLRLHTGDGVHATKVLYCGTSVRKFHFKSNNHKIAKTFHNETAKTKEIDRSESGRKKRYDFRIIYENSVTTDNDTSSDAKKVLWYRRCRIRMAKWRTHTHSWIGRIIRFYEAFLWDFPPKLLNWIVWHDFYVTHSLDASREWKKGRENTLMFWIKLKIEVWVIRFDFRNRGTVCAWRIFCMWRSLSFPITIFICDGSLVPFPIEK